VAIIGAGAGGVAAAYFLAGSFDVDLFEARSGSAATAIRG
jgi:predicted NAD/FAD-binding protein